LTGIKKHSYLSLAETLGGETASSVRNKNVLTDLDVILEGDVLNLNVLVGPLVEELARAIGAGENVSGQIESSHVSLKSMNGGGNFESVNV
jgi:hypothetical protein